MKINLLALFAVSMMTLFIACGDDESSDLPDGVVDETNKEFAVSGAVEKGPFVSGSTITMQPMNRKMKSVGSMYTATIKDNDGSFAFNSEKFSEPYARLQVNGYFFNEYTGELSKGPITLMGAVKLADKQSVNVNILTHLKYQRVMDLSETGELTFEEANEQAQKELLTAFGLQRYADTDVSRFSIASGTDESAALVAVSAMLLCDKTEARFTEYLQSLCQDFAKDGKFNETNKQHMTEDLETLSPQLNFIKRFVIERYDEIGRKITLKDLKYFLDFDGDGIAGNETMSPDEVRLSETEINVPEEGGEYDIKIESFMTPYLGVDSIIARNDSLAEYQNCDIKYSTRLDRGKLHISVSRTESIPRNVEIILYDYLKNVCGKVLVKQDASKDYVANLYEKNNESISGILESYRVAGIKALFGRYEYCTILKGKPGLDLRFGQLELGLTDFLRLFESPRAEASKITTAKSLLLAYESFFYNGMIDIWGDIPYPLEKGNLSRKNKDVIRDQMVAKLEGALKSEVSKTAISKLAYSLACIYMSRENYKEASDILHKYCFPDFAYEEKGSLWDFRYSIHNTWDAIYAMFECDYHLGLIDKQLSYYDEIGSWAFRVFDGGGKYGEPDGITGSRLGRLRRVFTNDKLNDNNDAIKYVSSNYNGDSRVDFDNIFPTLDDYINFLFRDNWDYLPFPEEDIESFYNGN